MNQTFVNNDALKESEERFRMVFQMSPDSINLNRLEDGVYVDINEGFIKIMGYAREEVIGKSSLSLNIWKNPEDRRKLIQGLVRTGYVENMEAEFTGKDGKTRYGLMSARILTVGGETLIISITRDITYRKTVEESLRKAHDELKQKAVELEDINTTLNILLKKREQDYQEIDQRIFSGYESIVRPFLNKLRGSLPDQNHQRMLDVLETNLKEIITPFSKKLSDPLVMLTPAEIQIALMIRQGYTSKEMSQTLHCSVRTIETHRTHIREKLGINLKKVNLRSFLSHL